MTAIATVTWGPAIEVPDLIESGPLIPQLVLVDPGAQISRHVP